MIPLVLAALLAASHVPCPGSGQHRSHGAKAAFRRSHPCPDGIDHGSTRRCRGYIIDHVCPLACCGLDAVQNMQWQTKLESKRKDRWETTPAGCKRLCAPELPGR